MGFGPTTSTLARLRSTPELYPHRFDVVFNSISKIKSKTFFYKLCNFFTAFSLVAEIAIYTASSL